MSPSNGKAVGHLLADGRGITGASRRRLSLGGTRLVVSFEQRTPDQGQAREYRNNRPSSQFILGLDFPASNLWLQP
jgi:hypothetical protein